MKKLLSTIMALVMLLSLVPMAVAEEGGAEGGAVPSNSVYKVTEAAQLVWAVENYEGDTIRLEKNVTLSETLCIGSADSEQKVLTLDLNGHSISATERVIMVQNANLTVAGPGKIYESSPYYGAINIKGSNGAENKDYTVVNIGAGVELEAWSPIFVTPFESSGAPYAYGVVVNVDGAKLTGVKDRTDDSGYAIYVNGQIKHQENAPRFVLNNVTQTATGAGMYLAGYADTTITGGSITGGDTGIEIRAGKLTLNDCALEATAKAFSCVPNGDGTTTAGAAIAIAQHTTKLDTAVTINGGSFKGVKALNESNPQKNDAESVKKVSVAVNGGTFNGDISAEDVTGFIKSGAFTDLANAVKYAADGAIITLAGDTTGQVVIPAGKTITLDLGGKTLTNTKTAILNYGTLTVDNGTIVSTSNVGIGVGDNSKTTIQPGVTIEAQEGAVITSRATGATITINGGNFLAKDNAVIAGNGTKRDGEANTITINGGTFTGNIKTSGYIACGIYAPWKDIITVNDGTFIVNGGTGVVGRAGQVYIKGGTFTCTGTGSGWVGDNKNQVSAGQICYFDSAANYPGYDKDADGIAISAGAFNVAPDAKYLAEGMIVVPGVKDAPYSVQRATSEDENSKSEVKVDGDKVTTTVTDKATGTTTETVTDTKTGAETVTKTENKVEGNVTTKTETVTEKNAAGETTKATETVTTEKTENGGKTTVVTKKDTLNKTETTEVTGVTAPTTAADVTLDVKNTTNVAVNKDSMTALKSDTVKDVVIETKDATLKLDKTAVKTMESNVPTNGKMTLNVTVTEEKNATTAEIEKVKVEVTAKNEAGENVFPENTANTNGLINITIPYTGNAKYLDLWYIAANDSATYMGRFPVVNGFVSFDVKHFSQYDLIPVASSGSSVIKTGAGSSAASTTQTVTTDLTPGSITKVTVDGKVVNAKYYTVSGSNVTFTAEFLKTLKNGSHTVTVENATKIAKGVFTVNNPTTAQSPTTADAGIALYAGMAIASVMGTGVVFTSRKRKNH